MARDRRRAAAIIQARKAKNNRANIGHTDVDFSWQKYRVCELCEGMYVTNNNRERKEKLVRWEGFIICPRCRYETVVIIKELVNGGVLAFTEVHQDRQNHPDKD